jgi:hypothetical protein
MKIDTPFCTIYIRNKTKRERAMAEFEPSMLNKIAGLIKKRMDDEFKDHPAWRGRIEED